jgi:hypothetical protein
MPVSYVVLPEHRVVDATFTLPLTREEVAEFQCALRADLRFDPAFRSVCTVTGRASDGLLTITELRSLLAESPYGREARRAFVVEAPVVYGMLRMLEVFNDGQVGEFGIHRHRDDALAWLGLPREDTAAV